MGQGLSGSSKPIIAGIELQLGTIADSGRSRIRTIPGSRKIHNRLLEEKPQIALFSDVRFKNEFFYVKAYGGYTVKVMRTGFEINDGRSSQHASEVDLDDITFDYEITVPDGEMGVLYEDAEAVFNLIIERVNKAAAPLSEGDGVVTQTVAA
jgi:hypothetical protein